MWSYLSFSREALFRERLIPDKLIEEHELPEKTETEEEEDLSDEAYDQGIRILTNLMKGETFDGFDIRAVPVLCNSSDIDNQSLLVSKWLI